MNKSQEERLEKIKSKKGSYLVQISTPNDIEFMLEIIDSLRAEIETLNKLKDFEFKSNYRSIAEQSDRITALEGEIREMREAIQVWDNRHKYLIEKNIKQHEVPMEELCEDCRVEALFRKALSLPIAKALAEGGGK